MKFNRWLVWAESLKRLGLVDKQLSNGDAIELLNNISQENTERGIFCRNLMRDETALHRHHAEIEWARDGKPYYKVWPRIAEELTKTQLNFDNSYLHSPYDIFEVALAGPDRRFGSTVLVAYLLRESFRLIGTEEVEKKHDKKVVAYLSLLYLMPEDEPGMVTNIHFNFFEGSTPAQDLEFMEVNYGSRVSYGENLEATELAELVSIVIGVMMFGIHNHELVLPDIKTPIIDGRGKRKKVLQKQAERGAAKDCNGWLVGSEIDLPQPEVVGSTCVRPGAGTPLKFGHMRSGHMRMQPCGPKNKDRKLIFLAPTVVRPDLTIRQSHGYRIKDELIKEGAL